MTPEHVASPRRRTVAALINSSAVRYLIAGGLSFLVDLGLLTFLHEILGWATWIAAGTAFIASFAFTYTVQRYFSFGSDAPHGIALLKYTLLVIFNTFATAAIVGLIDQTAAGWLVGKITATAVTTVWNYFAYRYWVFAAAPRPED